MLPKEKILVTGGAGFIGSWVVDYYIQNSYRVVVIDDLSNGNIKNLNKKAVFYKISILDPKIIKIIAREKPHILNHHAAQTNISASNNSPLLDARINILGFLNIIEQFKKISVSLKKIIFASSSAVYGNTDKLPVRENQMLKPISPYGISKQTIEYYLDYLYENFNIPYFAFRYGNVYGPRQKGDGEGGVISIFMKNFLEKKRPFIYGDGKQTRDFVYIEDIASANLLALKSKKNGVYNLATNKKTSIYKLYKFIKKLSNLSLTPIYQPPRKNDIKNSQLSFQKAKKDLGWNPKIKIVLGLKKTFNYIKST